jgi:hypothetical protein
MLRSETGEHLTGVPNVQLDIPRVIHRDEGTLHCSQQALLAGLATPVVHQLVAGHPDQPADARWHIFV